MPDWLINALLRLPFYAAGVGIAWTQVHSMTGLLIVAVACYVSQIKIEIHRR